MSDDSTPQSKQPRTTPPATSGGRVGPGTFMREVRGELRRVAWPSSREVTSYSIVVLVTVTVIGAFIVGLDQLFAQIVFWIFS